MRRLFLGAGIAVVALLAAVATYLALLDINQFRPQIQAAIEKQLGRQVSLGTMSLRIVPVSIRIQNVRIAEDPAFMTGLPFASAGEVSVSVSVLPLLRKQLHIQSFILREPSLELVRNAAGKWNFVTLGSGSRSSGGESAGGGLSIAELRIDDGRVAVSELGKRRSVYEHINLSVADFAPGKRFEVRLAAALPGKGSLGVEAAGGPLESAQAPFAGRIQVRQAALSALRQFLGAGAAQADGILDGEIGFELKNSVVDAQPRLAIDRIRVGGKDLGRGIRIDGGLQHDVNSGMLRMSNVKLAAGDVPLMLSGVVDTRKSFLDVSARTAGAPVAELLGLAAVAGSVPVTGSGRLDLDVRVRGPLDRSSELEYSGNGALRDAVLNVASLNKPLQVRSAGLKLSGKAASVDGLLCSLGSATLRGGLTVRDFAAPAAGFDLEIDRLDIAELQQTVVSAPSKGKSAAPPRSLTAKGTLKVGTLSYNDLVLTQVRSECSFTGGVLTLAPLTAQVFGGTETGGITVDLRSEPATVAVNTKLESVDANQLVSATTSLKRALFGMLAASGNAGMKLLPGVGGTRTLNGNLGLRLTNGRLGGINLMNELAGVGKFLGFTNSPQPFTDLVSLTGDIEMRDGVARTDNLLMQIAGGTVAAGGAVNLADETLNLKLTAVLDRDTSQKFGGSRVGGYLTTALVNSQGELVIPALVTGTFAKPRFAPDAARFAEMKLKSLLPSGKPGSLASGVLGALTGEKQTAPADAPQRKGFLGVLDRLQKKPEPPK